MKYGRSKNNIYKFNCCFLWICFSGFWPKHRKVSADFTSQFWHVYCEGGNSRMKKRNLFVFESTEWEIARIITTCIKQDVQCCTLRLAFFILYYIWPLIITPVCHTFIFSVFCNLWMKEQYGLTVLSLKVQAPFLSSLPQNKRKQPKST